MKLIRSSSPRKEEKEADKERGREMTAERRGIVFIQGIRRGGFPGVAGSGLGGMGWVEVQGEGRRQWMAAATEEVVQLWWDFLPLVVTSEWVCDGVRGCGVTARV